MRIGIVNTILGMGSVLLIVALTLLAIRSMVTHVKTTDHALRERLIEAEMKNVEKCRKLRGTLTYDRRMTFTGCQVPTERK
jgi:Na+-transporting methylmalonyl-CoA/oxaloacetate decarboxylase gamma subunit